VPAEAVVWAVAVDVGVGFVWDRADFASVRPVATKSHTSKASPVLK